MRVGGNSPYDMSESDGMELNYTFSSYLTDDNHKNSPISNTDVYSCARFSIMLF